MQHQLNVKQVLELVVVLKVNQVHVVHQKVVLDMVVNNLQLLIHPMA
jgi:hypothetical protein